MRLIDLRGYMTPDHRVSRIPVSLHPPCDQLSQLMLTQVLGITVIDRSVVMSLSYFLTPNAWTLWCRWPCQDFLRLWLYVPRQPSNTSSGKHRTWPASALIGFVRILCSTRLDPWLFLYPKSLSDLWLLQNSYTLGRDMQNTSHRDIVWSEIILENSLAEISGHSYGPWASCLVYEPLGACKTPFNYLSG